MRLTKLFSRFSLSIFIIVGLNGCNNGDEGLLTEPPALPNSIVDLIVTPKVAQNPKEFTVQFKAEAVLSDGQVLDVTSQEALSWQSSNSNIATIDSDGVATGVMVGSVTITASGQANGQNFSANAALEVTDAIVDSLYITPHTQTTPQGLTTTFTATAILSDGQILDVTSQEALSWQSSNSNIATIDSDGVATGVMVGSVTITASGQANGQNFSANAALDVTDAIVDSLYITPHTPTTPQGLTTTFTATAILSDGLALDMTSQEALSWQSSNSNIATIDSDGVAAGVMVGSVTITASGQANGQNFSANAALDVTDAIVDSLYITPHTQTTPQGLTTTFTATAILSDGLDLDVTSQEALSWQSSNSNIATIDSDGVATGVMVGSVTITASGQANGQNFSANAVLEVTDSILLSIEVLPNSVEVNLSGSRTLVATGVYSDGSMVPITSSVNWLGQDTNIAMVQGGKVTGVSLGITETTAFFDSVRSTPVAVNVLDPTLSVCGNESGFPIDTSPTGGVNNSDQSNATGYCLKVREVVGFDGIVKWYTSSPSELVMNRLAYTSQNVTSNSNDTYAILLVEDGTEGPTGSFALFLQSGVGVTIPGENGQLDRWCQKLDDLNFAGRKGWSRASRNELKSLFDFENSGATSFYNLWGWPATLRYWTETLDEMSPDYILVSLKNNSEVTKGNGTHYASCVADVR